MIPKFHKPTLDYRYIAAGTTSSTKTVSKILTGVLKLINETVKREDRFICKFKNYETYWIASNKECFVNILDYLNNRFIAKSIISFDFKKLYTNILHKDVIDKISLLVQRCFDLKSVIKISVSNSYNASWSSRKNVKWSFTCDDIIDMFSFLINNIFVKYRGDIYKQVIGIPMGCDCAPQIADLYLYYYEREYILKASELDNNIVNELSFCKRYIDDLAAPNISNAAISIICNDIYPKDLEIVPTNSSDSNSTFLDLDISIVNRKFHWKLYDKRRDFKFSVITFPNLDSKVSNRLSYGTLIGELYRICKSSSHANSFVSDVRILIDKLINQNYELNIVKSSINKFIHRRPSCLNRFWHDFKVTDFV